MPALVLTPTDPVSEPSEAAAGQKSGAWAWLARRPLATTILLAFAGALLLQFWRPCFFLTGDTLSAWLPVAVEAYRRVWEGHSPFYDPYLFGGIDLRQDLGSFILINPWALLVSPLAKTPYYFLIPDCVGTCSLVTIAGAFCWSALRLRRQFDLPVQPAMIVALSLSYAFTPFTLLVGASWIGFISATAAYPVILAGACERNWRKALAIQTAAVAYALIGGHLHPFMMMGLFMTPVIAGICLTQRRWQGLAVWAAAGVIPLLLSLPLLWPAMAGFQHTERASGGLPAEAASLFNVSAPHLAASFFLGSASNVILPGIRIDHADPLYNLAIAFALVNLPLAALLCVKRRWTMLEVCLAVPLAASAVCIVRPGWLAFIFAHLPLLHSLRWPYREIAVLHFFTHALFLLAFRPPTGEGMRRLALAAGTVGTTIYLLVFLCLAPTLWLFKPDRQLIMSGEADRYWASLKAAGFGAENSRYAIEAPWYALLPQLERVPCSLLGTFNYAALFRVHNVSGFSVTPPPSAAWLQRDCGAIPYFWGGIFSPNGLEHITRAYPEIERIELNSAVPAATWTVSVGAASHAFLYDPIKGLVYALPPQRSAHPTPP